MSNDEDWRLTGHHAVVAGDQTCVVTLRFLRMWLSFHPTPFRAGEWRQTPNWHMVVAMSFAGMRGAITLAGVLTLPLAVGDGSPFHTRIEIAREPVRELDLLDAR